MKVDVLVAEIGSTTTVVNAFKDLDTDNPVFWAQGQAPTSVLEGDVRVIRIRDDCVTFDPVHHLKLHESDDPTAHVGIRMVMKTAREANYLNSLGWNNLTLVF